MASVRLLMIMGAALATAPLLGGCEAVMIGIAAPMVIKQKHVNLVNASYAAADILSQQAGKRFPRDQVMMVSDLREIINNSRERMVTNPKVGRVVSRQLRERFVQLGYNVVDADSYSGGMPRGEVTGTYEILDGTISISLKLVDRNTEQVITTYAYSLPVTYEIKKYMSPQQKFFEPFPNMPALPPLI